jgi:hypothetical protein
MIKLLTLFLTLSVANAQTLSYLLPDQKGLFEHALSTHLKKANKEIVILTPTLKYAALRTQLIRSSSKGITVTLIAQNPADDPLGLVAYHGIELYLYSARPLMDTLIFIDDTTVCHLSESLNDKELARKTQSALCSDDPDLIRSMQHNVSQIIKRSKPYLK